MRAAARKAETIVSPELPDWVFDLLEDETDYRTFWVTKGLGAGGTYGLAMWHYAMCLINSKSPFSWCIGPTYQQVTDTLLPTFGEVLSTEFGLVEGKDYNIRVSATPGPKITFPRRGQEIWLRSANRADRMVGPSISHCSGTEVGLWPRTAYEKSSGGRLRCPKAVRRQYLGEGTPEGFNWWQKEADFDEGVNQQTNSRRVVLHTADNRHLKPGYVENMKRRYAYDAGKLQSYLYGFFVPFTKGSAYWEFAHQRNVVLDVRPSEYLPIIFTWDFGVSPLAWVGMQRQPIIRKSGSREHRFVALAEGSGKARGLMDACAEFIVAFPPSQFRETPIYVHGGHDGYAGTYLAPSCAFDQIYQYLKKYYRHVEIRAAKAAPTVQARLERVNALMAYDIYVIAAWCRNLIDSHTRASLKEGTWELEKKKDDPTHFSDAVGDPLFQLTADLDLELPMTRKTYGMNL